MLKICWPLIILLSTLIHQRIFCPKIVTFLLFFSISLFQLLHSLGPTT